MKPGMHWRMVPWFCSSWFHTLQYLTFSLDMRGECAGELDGDQSFTVLRYGGFHLVTTEVVPVGGSADKQVEFISIKMTCLHRFWSFDGKIFGGGASEIFSHQKIKICATVPPLTSFFFFFFSKSVLMPYFVIQNWSFRWLYLLLGLCVWVCCLWASEDCLI